MAYKLRMGPLHHLLLNGAIGEGMWRAGCWLEGTHWLATRQPGTIPPWRGPAARVAPPATAMPFAHSRADAREQLARAERALGRRLWAVLLAVLIEGKTFREVPLAAELIVARDPRSLERVGGALLRLALFMLADHLADTQ